MKGSNFKRHLNDVMEDCLWPAGGIGYQPGRATRYNAMHEVLCTIPEQDYGVLADKFDIFDWFVPDYDMGACTHPFHATVFPEKEGKRQSCPCARVIYLSPRLERERLAVAIATIAHELAHVLLEHSLEPEQACAQEQEDEAWQRVRDWGFERELSKYIETWKQRDARLQTKEEK